MSSQHNINLELTKNVQVRIVLPLTISDKIDIDNIETRNWLVSGEKTTVFIVTTPSLSPLEAFSFYCTVTDSEHTGHVEKVPNQLQLMNVTTRSEMPNSKPFRLPDNRMVFPVRIQVPSTQSRGVIVSAFCQRNTDPDANPLNCFCLQPFTAFWKRCITPQSVIIQISIRTKLPKEWQKDIEILETNLKFNEAAADESELTSSIAIIKNSDSRCRMNDGDCLSVAFSLKPISDRGAMKIPKLPLIFTISWKADTKEMISAFPISVGDETADLVVSAPMIKCELLKPSMMPLRITNMRPGPRKVTLCFGSGKVQPMMKNCEVIFDGETKAKSVEFGFIPLCAGEHKLKIWAEEDGKHVAPMFPVCLSVQKPE